jgi:hypothetical protein
MPDNITEDQINDSGWLRPAPTTTNPTPSSTPLVSRGGYSRPTSSPTIGTYQNALTAQRNLDSTNAANFNTAIQSATASATSARSGDENRQPATTSVGGRSGDENRQPATTSVVAVNGGGGGSPTPVAQVDTRTQVEKEAAYYAALQSATDAAKAGDPTLLRNFDKYFNFTRPEAEYSQSFYYGSTPTEQINLINNMPISQDMKAKVIAESQAMQAGARGTDSVENVVAWFNAGGPVDPGTETFLSNPQNKINVVNATNISDKAKTDIITEILSGNPDTVPNMVTYHGVHGLGQSPSAANWASSAYPENQIAVVNASNISQDMKNKVIAEIRAGSNTADTVNDKINWFKAGNQPSPGALAILNPPPPAVTQPAPEVVTPTDQPASGNSDTIEVQTSAPEPPSDLSDISNGAGQKDSSTSSVEHGKEAHNKDHVKATATNTEHKKESTSGVVPSSVNLEQGQAKKAVDPAAMAARKAAIESRLQKIAAMRQPYGGTAGATSVVKDNGNMVPPPIAGGSASQNGLPKL